MAKALDFLFARVRVDPFRDLYTTGDLAGFLAIPGEPSYEKLPFAAAFQAADKLISATNGRVLILVREIECRADVVRSAERDNPARFLNNNDRVFLRALWDQADWKAKGTPVAEIDGAEDCRPCECVEKSGERKCIECRGVGLRYDSFEFDGREFNPSYRGILERIEAALIPRIDRSTDIVQGYALPTYFKFHGGIGAICPTIDLSKFKNEELNEYYQNQSA